MRYLDLEQILSRPRMQRYLLACGGQTKKSMTLYRLNLKLSQELFTIISCFEVTLRNAINVHCLNTLGSDWLRNGASTGGIFDNSNCRQTKININDAIRSLNANYTHNKLVAELGFGFWRFMFASHQYLATGRTLLQIFPSKPTSSSATQYNQNYVFNQLADINHLRNRIAHHEPICFIPGQAVKDTLYARQHYNLILQLFQWMSINETSLLYGLDHVLQICHDIDTL